MSTFYMKNSTNKTAYPHYVYVLYGGSSVDGMGDSVFKKMTYDKNEALMHLKKISNNPYSKYNIIQKHVKRK